MRVLSLHGLGTNSRIFRAQTESLRALLPSNHSFCFYDGVYDTDAADNVGKIYPPPYLAYYPKPTASYVSRAHELIRDLVEDEGPFDAIMGFSQGAALAASFLLHCQLAYPHAPAPFRFAIFICASLPYVIDEHSGVEMATTDKSPSTIPVVSLRNVPQPPFLVDCNESVPPSNQHLSQLLAPSRSSATTGTAAATSSTSSVITIDDDNSTSPSSSCDDGLWPAMDCMRRFHPDVDAVRIAIHTVHILGRRDPFAEQGRLLAKLCESRLATSYEHGEGHNIPRSQVASRAIARVIDMAVERCEAGG